MRTSEIFLGLLPALGAFILLGLFYGGILALLILLFFYLRTRRLEEEETDIEPTEDKSTKTGGTGAPGEG